MSRVKKKCIGIVFGGDSNEHNISILSAKTVFDAFNSKNNKKQFKIKFFYISKAGIWLNHEESKQILIGKREDFKISEDEVSNHKKINFLENIEFYDVDIWFPLLHGINGEDGAIHGLLKFTQKPLIGCGILGSALGMDKIIMKKVFTLLEIPQVKYLAIQNEDINDKNVKKKLVSEILKKLNFPVFVKPSNSGSSLGITKVKDRSEIFKALEKAFKVDSRILIEEGLEVREVECGVIGNKELVASKVGEVKYDKDWYDYESKYSRDNQIIIPAQINPEITKQIQEISIRSCKALNIFGFARVDFFLEKFSNKIFLNEINTIPGFTQKSMFPLLWEASGLNIDQLVAKLVGISLDL